MKTKLMLLPLAAIFLAGCAATVKPMPSLSKLVERENEIGVGITGASKNGGALLIEYEDPSLNNWTLVVVKDMTQKALLNDIFLWQKADKHCTLFPTVMTIDEYAGQIRREDAPKPGPQPGDYQTIEQRIASMRSKLEQHSAIIYRYLHGKK